MRKLVAIMAIAALGASDVFGVANVIDPSFSGIVDFSTSLGRSHGGAPGRFATLGAGHDQDVSNGAGGIFAGDQVEQTVYGNPNVLTGDPGVKGDFFSVFTIDDIQGGGGSVLDIPAGKRIAGIFYGLEDSEVTGSLIPGEVFVESTGGRMEFYLINNGGSIYAPGLAGASWDGAGNLTYLGINDGATLAAAGNGALWAIDLTPGELGIGDSPFFELTPGTYGSVNGPITEIRSLNTNPGGAANNNGVFYAQVDLTFGNTVLANRLNSAFTGNALNISDFEADYTMNLNTNDPGCNDGPGLANFNCFGLTWNDPLRAQISAIPEPSTILLLGTGLMGLVAYRRRNAA